MKTDKTISSFIQSQLPDFITENHPNFQAFLEAYYEWMETSNNPYLKPYKTLSYRDVDDTLDVFIDQIKNELIHLFPKRLNKDINVKYLMKNIKQFYESKGTEKSIKFIFRIIFDEEINISYPKELMLLASDGKWVENISIKSSDNNNKIENLVGNIVYQQKPKTLVPTLKVRPLNNSEKAYGEFGFNRCVDIFGIKIFAGDDTGVDNYLISSLAAILANLIDNNSDGIVDNVKAINAITSREVHIFAVDKDESSYDFDAITATGALFDVIDLTGVSVDDLEGNDYDEKLEKVINKLLDFLLVWGYAEDGTNTFSWSSQSDSSTLLQVAYERAIIPLSFGWLDASLRTEDSSPSLGAWPINLTPSQPHTLRYYFTTGLLINMGWYDDTDRCSLLQLSWDFCDSDTFKETDILFNELIENTILPTTIPTTHYRPTRTNTDPTVPKETTAFARVTAVQKYKTTPYLVNEIFLHNIIGEFDGDFPLLFEEDGTIYEEELFRVFTDFAFSNKGLRYKENDEIKITTNSLTIPKFSYNESGDTLSATVIRDAEGVGARAVIDKIGDNGEIKSIRITNFGLNYNEPHHGLEIISDSGVLAEGTILSGWTAKYQGLWQNDDGKLSTIKRLRDNNRYHEYSYAIESLLTLEQYKNTLKSLVHPSGMAVFGDIGIQGGDAFTLLSNVFISKNELPLIGNYLPYTLQTDTNLRLWNNSLAGREDSLTDYSTDELHEPLVDLYPAGFDITLGPVAEDGSVAHAPGTNGPIDTGVENIFFDNVPTVSDDDQINTYWVVFPHPYSRLEEVVDSDFSDITIDNFVKAKTKDFYFGDEDEGT